MKKGFAPIISLVGILVAAGVISGVLFVRSIKPVSQQNCQATLTTQITDAIDKALKPPPDRYFEIDQIKVNRECKWAIVTIIPKDMLGQPLGDPFLIPVLSRNGKWEVTSSENPVYGLWLQLINYLNNLLVRIPHSSDSIQPTSTPDASRKPTHSTINTAIEVAGDTSNWKTYISSEGKYSISYPGDYKINPPIESLDKNIPEVTLEPDPQTVKFVSPPLPKTKRHLQLIINFELYPQQISLDEAIKRYSCTDLITSREISSYNVDGKPAMLFEGTKCGVSGNSTIITVNNNYIYTFLINYTSGIDQYSDFRKYVDQILSTFRFVE